MFNRLFTQFNFSILVIESIILMTLFELTFPSILGIVKTTLILINWRFIRVMEMIIFVLIELITQILIVLYC